MNKVSETLTRVFLSAALATGGCTLPETQIQQPNQPRPTRNAGPGYLGNFERTIPPDDGQEYSSSDIPSGWKIYERRSTRPEGHVDEKRGIYIEDGTLYIVGQSRLWDPNSESSAIDDANRDAERKFGELVLDSDGDGSFSGFISGLYSEAIESVIVKRGGEVALVVETRNSIPLQGLPRDTRRRIESRYSGR